MTNIDFANKCKKVATSTKTVYVRGGWGQPLTTLNKLYFKANYSFNRSTITTQDANGNTITSNRADVINKASSDTFAFDCSCFIKSMLDGFYGSTTQKYGGATYGKPCKDITIDDMLKECTEVSEDFSNIQIGEFVVFADKSHCGVYVGNGEVVECTYRWKDGVQITSMTQEGRKGMWKYHGKMSKYMTYGVSAKESALKNAREHLRADLDSITMAKQGVDSDYVKAIQEVLVALDYYYVSPVGYFGADTERAVKDFQRTKKLNPTGIVDFATAVELMNM